MANIISPKDSIPVKGIERNGFLNKTQLMRDFIKGNPKCTKDEAISFIMNTKRAASPTGYSHAATLYRNVTEENVRIVEDRNKHKKDSDRASVSNFSQMKSGSSPFRLITPEPEESKKIETFVLAPVSDPSNAEQFERFLVQFKSICQNPYARGLAKAYIDALDEAALNETKKTG